MNLKIDFEELNKLVQESIPADLRSLLGEDEKFVYWFLKAHLTDKNETITEAIVGGAGDKGIDAVYIDKNAQKVFIIQGKFRQSLGLKKESQHDLKGFFSVESCFKNQLLFHKFLQNIKPEVKEQLVVAYELVKKHNFVVNYYYVTTGNISEAYEKMIRNTVKVSEDALVFFDAVKIKDLAENYIYAFVPGVSDISLRFSRTGDSEPVRTETLDGINVSAWLLNVTGYEISEIVRENSYRIFNRNVRGFLGRGKKVNKDIEFTATKYPEKFWYYNNGVTMVCSDAKFVDDNEVNIITPQIINGQQTAKILESLYSLNDSELKKIGVLLRLIKVDAGAQSSAASQKFIKQVVKSSNWQNSISSSDLMANEPEQVQIERVLKPFGFYYMRRKMTKTEANLRGARRLPTINRDDMGKALAVTNFNPSFAKSKDLLYRDENYGKIFAEKPADFYLTRYLTMVLVKEAARSRGGDYTRANWAALSCIWKDIGEYLTDETAKRFIAAYKRRIKGPKNEGSLAYLIKASVILINNLVEFFRSEEKKASDTGEKMPNIADFLRQSDIVEKYNKYIVQKNKGEKEKYSHMIEKFTSTLKEESLY